MDLFCLLRGILKNQVVFNCHLLRWVNRSVQEPSKSRRLPNQSKLIITNIFNNTTYIKDYLEK